MMVAPKAVAYVCERLGEEGSLKHAANQIETLKALADLEGYQLVGCYTDILMPGQETRPALEKLIQDAERKSFAEVFIVCAQPRWSAVGHPGTDALWGRGVFPEWRYRRRHWMTPRHAAILRTRLQEGRDGLRSLRAQEGRPAAHSGQMGWEVVEQFVDVAAVKACSVLG
jgi:hypothetical protein